MTGWISLHRKVRDNWLFAEKRSFSKFEAWIDLLMEVNHQDNKVLLGNELIEVKRGQKVTSMQQLSDRWGWGKPKTYNFVKLLEKEQMITVKSNTKRTVITIVNYDVYQLSETQNKTPTEHEQNANVPQTYTNNNDNNVNKDNNLNNTTTKENAFSFFQENFTPVMTPYFADEINYCLDDFNGQDEIVVYAMRIALERNKRNIGYVKGILKKWLSKGAKTLEECQIIQNQNESKKPNVSVNGHTRQNNIDWGNI